MEQHLGHELYARPKTSGEIAIDCVTCSKGYVLVVKRVVAGRAEQKVEVKA